jgi:hypothetical protein
MSPDYMYKASHLKNLLTILLSSCCTLTEFPRLTLLLQSTDMFLVFRVKHNCTLKGLQKMLNKQTKNKLRDLSLRANYTDRAIVACRRR